jgi:hypothetical protein
MRRDVEPVPKCSAPGWPRYQDRLTPDRNPRHSSATTSHRLRPCLPPLPSGCADLPPIRLNKCLVYYNLRPRNQGEVRAIGGKWVGADSREPAKMLVSRLGTVSGASGDPQSARQATAPIRAPGDPQSARQATAPSRRSGPPPPFGLRAAPRRRSGPPPPFGLRATAPIRPVRLQHRVRLAHPPRPLYCIRLREVAALSDRRASVAAWTVAHHPYWIASREANVRGVAVVCEGGA